MRCDTPPHSNCSDDDVERELEARMEINAMLAEEGVLIDDDYYDIEDDDYNDDDDDELEEIGLEELEQRLGVGLHDTPEDKSILTFREHTSPVFSCHIHPEFDIAVTGGQDDVAILWNMLDGTILQKTTEHTDTVTTAKFSYDGNYLLTADMAGCICVFRVQMNGTTEPHSQQQQQQQQQQNGASKPQYLNKVWSIGIGDLSWCFWHDRAHVVFASSAESGEIYMYRIPSGDCKVFVGPGCCCVAGELTEDGKKLFASYVNGNLRLWDLRTVAAILSIDDEHNSESIPSVACDKHSALYASGDRNGKIVFCTQNGPVQSANTVGLVECLAFSPSAELKMLASATLEGETTIWDYTHFTKRVTCKQPDEQKCSVCSMKWLNGNHLAIGTADGDIHIYDARSGTLKHTLSGHTAHVYEFFYSRRMNMLLSVSEDSTAKLFAVPELDD